MRTLLAAGYPLLHVRRIPEIVGLPPRLAFFRIISSESVCSAKKIFAKKGIFGTKTLISALFGPFQALFGPFLTAFNEKNSIFGPSR